VYIAILSIGGGPGPLKAVTEAFALGDPLLLFVEFALAIELAFSLDFTLGDKSRRIVLSKVLSPFWTRSAA
jgi:hypothetical protein